MPSVQRLDTRAVHTQRDSTEAGVCEHAPLQHKRDPHWPFLYYESSGVTYINRTINKSKYASASEVGVAEF